MFLQNMFRTMAQLTLSIIMHLHIHNTKNITISNTSIFKKLQKLALTSQAERTNALIDQQSFTYTHLHKIDPNIFKHAVCLPRHESNSTILNGELHQQFPYDVNGITMVNLVGTLDILVFLENCYTFSITKNLLKYI